MRGHGEGSINHRKDGRWQAQISLDSGKRKTLYGKTRKEVQEKLRQAINEQKQGVLATGPQQTLETYLTNWIDNVCKPRVRKSTYMQYRSVIRAHLIPAFGRTTIQGLKPAKIQSLYAKKLEEGLAPSTIGVIHGVLHKALEDAVRWNLVSRNVSTLVSLPRIDRPEMRVLTPEQAHKLIEVARGSRIEALLVLAITTGARRGELLALRWDDVDLDNGVISIQHTMSRVGGYGYVENDPKTKAGRRRIMLPDAAIDALKEHKVRQEQARVKAKDRWKERGIVFCNIYGGFLNPDAVLKWYHALLNDAGLPIMRFHDLRHSAATILLVMGVHPKVVQELLGHSTVAMTMDVYSHLLPSMHREATNRMNDVFKRP
jgi:integrase